jgi:cellulose synthase/poly-beta-1,6-N-acetylglucosamine synthase-like glycosyltransferase
VPSSTGPAHARRPGAEPAGTGPTNLVPTPRRAAEDDRPAVDDPPRHRPGAALFPRLIGLIILGLATGAAVLLVLAAIAVGDQIDTVPTEGVVLGLWDVLYASQAPTPRMVLSAMALAVLLAAAVAGLELRISNQSRRSADADADPLAPKVVMARTEGVYAGPVTVTVLIPAHNEEATLPHTIASLVGQSHPPERILVVADNCTDATVDVARRAGAEVVESVANTHKKAGALNQVLTHLLPGQGDNDAVMIMDADTTLDDGFLEAAVARLTADRGLMAIGGLFYGEEGAGLLGQFQRNEYTRYSRDIRRRRGRVFVLTGTASLFRPALTEDNELTIALKSLGALMISPAQCTVVTEVMPTWRALWNQRLRWQRGALENLGAYGLTPRTFRYWAQQLGIGYGVIALASYFLLFAVMAVAADSWIWFPFWMGLGLVFVVERVIGVWDGGWRARLLGATLLPELVFATFLDVVYVKGVLDIGFGRQARWTHLTRTAPADGTGVGAATGARIATTEDR